MTHTLKPGSKVLALLLKEFPSEFYEEGDNWYFTPVGHTTPESVCSALGTLYRRNAYSADLQAYLMSKPECRDSYPARIRPLTPAEFLNSLREIGQADFCLDQIGIAATLVRSDGTLPNVPTAQ